MAHPGLTDPNFKRTVILISEHNEERALGVVINRPLNKSLGEYMDVFAFGPLAEVPLYSGGPVGQDKLILTAWKWDHDTGIFKLYFGLEPDKAQTLLAEEPDLEIRGFLGYASWGKGQIEEDDVASAIDPSDPLTRELARIFDRAFLPIARTLKANGSLQIDRSAGGATTTWRDLASPGAARDTFEIPAELDSGDADPETIAEALTSCWTPGEATEALRPLVAELLKLGRRYPLEESLEERVEDSVYVMF